MFQQEKQCRARTTSEACQGSKLPFSREETTTLNKTRILSIAGVAIATFISATLTSATPSGWQGSPAQWVQRQRTQTPEDRYAMAGGCYAIRTTDGRYISRSGGGYSAGSTALADAEPFHFQATDLGKYLLFDSGSNFLAASEGAVGTAAYAATGSLPGQLAAAASMDKTDAAAKTAAGSEANSLTGRGSAVVAATTASELAEFEIGATNSFDIALPATGQHLNTDGSGNLVLGSNPSAFSFELTQGCASFPEIEVNVDGPVMGSPNEFQETRGLFDGHGHMMAFEFIGGRVRCGRPWHPYGVSFALVDCPDHQPGGQGAVLEQVLSGVGPHTTDGWPTFNGWPKNYSLTHEQLYYKWMERAWRSGLRMYTNLLVDNGQLCKAYPLKRNSCNEMDGVRLQAQRIRELERYIDAQWGGPGRGWFRIVTDPFMARRVINEGRLAVILGIEVSVPLDCGITLDIVNCDQAKIDKGLDEVYALGVRQMELVNKFDNALSGVTGDSGSTGIVVNQGNLGETGRYWQLETCPANTGEAHDKQQTNFADDSGAPDQFAGRDSIFGGVLAVTGRSGAAPVYPEGPHCNVRGLSDLGRYMIQGLARRGMIFDPDHMSAKARTSAMDLIQSMGYSGVMSSHSWSDDTIYPRIYKSGGMVTPHPGNSTSFVEKWRKSKAWADPRFYFGIGYGADTNGFSTQGAPRGASAPAAVTYPFTGFGGATIYQQKSGSRTYNINTDGVAHYGLYPDWLQDVRNLVDQAFPGQGDVFYEDMLRGPEAYLQMWERAIGVKPDSCRTDVADLTDGQINGLQAGMMSREVLELLGQPSSRLGSDFTYCATGGRTATLTFTPAGQLASWTT